MTDPELLNAMARNVGRLMEARGMSRRQLASSVGVAPMTINRLLRGEHMVSAAVAYRIADFFGVPSDALRAAEKKVRLRA